MSMFEIKPVSSLPNDWSLVGRGLQFGFLDIPMVFEVASKVIAKPYPVRMTVKKDSEKKETRLEKPPVGKDGADITLVNPFTPGPTVSTDPISVLVLRNPEDVSAPTYELLMHFAASAFADTKHFLFCYEFYERSIPAPTQKEPTEGPK